MGSVADAKAFAGECVMANPNLTDIPALLAQGEGETLEFKRSVAELDQVVETVAALTNTRGGLVLIGVGPDGGVVGVGWAR